MNKKILSAALVLLMALSSLTFASCDLFGIGDDSDSGSGSGTQTQSDSDFDDPAFENEMDGAELVVVPHKEKDFYGKWATASQQAEYLFGNVELKIDKDGSWSGNITDEKFKGKWQYTDSGLRIKDKEGIINWELFFVEDGSLMFKDLDDPDLTPLVLKKK